MKIYLIGMPGSGKSVMGRQLAMHFNLPFIDLDSAIEEAEGKSVQEIFREDGETRFREKEAERLRELSDSSSGFVMATGGGTPCFHAGMEVINNSGVSIYLNVSLAELTRRNRNTSSRPLLRDGNVKEKLTTLYTARDPVYKQATFIISGDQLSVKDAIAILKK